LHKRGQERKRWLGANQRMSERSRSFQDLKAIVNFGEPVYRLISLHFVREMVPFLYTSESSFFVCSRMHYEAVSRCRSKCRLARQLVRDIQPNIAKCGLQLRTCSKWLPGRSQGIFQWSLIEKSRRLDPLRKMIPGPRSIAPAMLILSELFRLLHRLRGCVSSLDESIDGTWS